MQKPSIVRVFTIDGDDVECRFFTPEHDQGDYRCRYEIDLPNKPIASEGYGVDQVQALLLAMQKAHVELLVMREKLKRSVKWLGDENLGLPINEAIQDLAPDNSY